MNTKNLILIVDDKPYTHALFRDFLKKKHPEKEIAMALDFAQALKIVNDRTPELYCVVLDLFFPDIVIPEILKNLNMAHTNAVSMNQGQLLGEYLHDRKIPYFYLSAFSDKYQTSWESEPAPVCLDKGATEEAFEKALNESASKYEQSNNATTAI